VDDVPAESVPLAPAPRWKDAAAGPQGPRSRRGPVLAVLAAALAVTGALAAWLLYPSPYEAPYFLGLWVDQYDDPALPDNRWAGQDRAALRGVWPEGREGFNSQTYDLFVEELRNLDRRPARETVVVLLSGIALPRADGRGVDLLLADSRLGEPAPLTLPSPPRGEGQKRGVPLAEVFRQLQECPARHKLLILDVMQSFTDVRAGVLAAEVAEVLEPELQEALRRDERLHVLTACSPGQVSLASEELGHTLFGYHLLRGLRGRADRTGEGRVSLRELDEYVAREVDRWAWHNQGVRQTPRLLGKEGVDYSLSEADPDTTEDEAGLATDYPGWMRSAWERRDAWWKDGSYRLVLDDFRGLEEGLLRAERRLRGGADPARLREEIAGRVAALEGKRRQAMAALPMSPRSLSAALAQLPAPADSVDSRRQLARLAARAKPPAPAGAVTVPDPEVAAFLKTFEGKSVELAGTVFAVAAEEEQPDRVRLAFLAGLLPVDLVQEYPETRWLRALADLPVPPASPSRAAGYALRAVEQGERGAAGDPLALPWVAGRLRSAAERLEKGRTLLFSTNAADRVASEVPLREAAAEYERANRDLDVITRARRASDEVRLRLPGCVAYLVATGRDDAAAEVLERAVTAAQRLKKLLASPPADGVAGDGLVRELAELVEGLTDPHYLTRLCRPLGAEAFPPLIGRSRTGGPSDASVMGALLETPALDAARRAALWSAWRRLSHRLREDYDARGADALPPSAWTDADRESAGRAERERGVWRARLAISLARLERDLHGEQLDGLRRQLARAERREVPLRDLGGDLRALWFPR